MRIIANVTTDTNGFDFMVARLAFSLVVDGYGLPPPPAHPPILFYINYESIGTWDRNEHKCPCGIGRLNV